MTGIQRDVTLEWAKPLCVYKLHRLEYFSDFFSYLDKLLPSWETSFAIWGIYSMNLNLGVSMNLLFKQSIFVILSLFVFQASFSSDTNNCSHIGRATVTDQKGMAVATALRGLGIKQDSIIYLESSDYVSWKGEQKGCLANILHKTKIKVIYKTAIHSRCETTLDLHTKDHFLSADDEGSLREYKMRNLEESCYDENEEMIAQTNRCDSQEKCPLVDSVRLVKDYYDNCNCKSFLDTVRTEDTGDTYKDFFNPNKSYLKPESINSPFEKE